MINNDNDNDNSNNNNNKYNDECNIIMIMMIINASYELLITAFGYFS